MSNLILTAQEHKLFGGGVPDKYEKKPYTPMAIIDEELSVEECNRLRKEKEKSDPIEGAFVGYWGVRGLSGRITLEHLVLDKNSPYYGQTVRDPVLVEVENLFRDDFNDWRSELDRKSVV